LALFGALVYPRLKRATRRSQSRGGLGHTEWHLRAQNSSNVTVAIVTLDGYVRVLQLSLESGISLWHPASLSPAFGHHGSSIGDRSRGGADRSHSFVGRRERETKAPPVLSDASLNLCGPNCGLSLIAFCRSTLRGRMFDVLCLSKILSGSEIQFAFCFPRLFH
jgi:hypothetical protein